MDNSKLSQNNIREIRYYVKQFFTGQLDIKIQRCRKRLDEGFSRYHYNTLNSAFVGERKRSDNLHGDPTAWRAINLAELHYQKKFKLDFLLQLKDTLTKLEKKLSPAKVEIAKKQFGCSDKTLEEIAANSDLSKYKVGKLREDIKRMFCKRIEPLLEDYIKHL